jgi:hypothetical protein
VDQQLRDVPRQRVGVQRHGEVERAVGVSHVLAADLLEPVI